MVQEPQSRPGATSPEAWCIRPLLLRRGGVMGREGIQSSIPECTQHVLSARRDAFPWTTHFLPCHWTGPLLPSVKPSRAELWPASLWPWHWGHIPPQSVIMPHHDVFTGLTWAQNEAPREQKPSLPSFYCPRARTLSGSHHKLNGV